LGLVLFALNGIAVTEAANRAGIEHNWSGPNLANVFANLNHQFKPLFACDTKSGSHWTPASSGSLPLTTRTNREVAPMPPTPPEV
jgi:hypothetical protein